MAEESYSLAILRLELIYAVQAHIVAEVFPCKTIAIDITLCLEAMNGATTKYYLVWR